jgi:hypothetical protein
MGLLDELAGRTFDAVIDGQRSRRHRHEAFVTDLVDQLRAYSAHIEETRIAFQWLMDALEGGRLRSVELPTAIATLAVDDYDVGRLFDNRALKTLTQLGLLPLHTAPVGSFEFQLMNQLSKVVTSSEELDTAWAHVRPLLDDALEVKAVLYLRRFRHDLRYRVNYSLSRVEATFASPDDREALASAIESVRTVLQATDLWNNEIADVRRSAQTKKRRQFPTGTPER